MDDAAFVADCRLRARAAGLSEAEAARITGHSWRAGGATDMVIAGVPAAFIMRQGRWLGLAFLVYFRLSRAVYSDMSSQLMASLIGRTASYLG